mmetsp:Transcript_5080/g.12190  ORF Transcript_5080/g.12190 Transcript_5080/m.12190 type:complete len:87 (-) Transcript_5080:128-388(-)
MQARIDGHRKELEAVTEALNQAMAEAKQEHLHKGTCEANIANLKSKIEQCKPHEVVEEATTEKEGGEQDSAEAQEPQQGSAKHDEL